jgi:hypothetical protein
MDPFSETWLIFSAFKVRDKGQSQKRNNLESPTPFSEAFSFYFHDVLANSNS